MVILFELVRRWAPVLLISGLAMWMQLRIARWLMARGWGPGTRIALGASWTFLAVAALFAGHQFSAIVPAAVCDWIVAASMIWSLATLCVFPVTWPRARPAFDPGRRQLLGAAKVAAIAAPALAGGYGVFIERTAIRIREVDLPLLGLPPALAGLRIVQITDIHRGAFFSRADLDRAVSMANEAKANLAVVTGDLISRHGDPLDDCLAGLARLKAEAGVLGCHGNHEVYAGCLQYATTEAAKRGIRILRGEATTLRFGDAVLNVVGVDYQKMKSPYLAGCERLLLPAAANLLLSHNPDVFPVASKLGFDAVLSGHTHGGQINVEILDGNANLARVFTPYTRGLYRDARSALYVSPGLGTVGVPMRVGAPPEVTVVRLCAS